MALLNEQIDGKYEILAKLREGGMGSIYKVRHRLLDEVRVVKVIRSQGDRSQGDRGEEAADRFLSEAKSAIKLRHPNVAVLHDFAVGGDGQAFIVMEYIDGWNLLEVLNGYGPPPVALTLEIARQSLKALGYLHRHKIVHRDVSPDNLMLTRDVDGNPLVKLIDLGIAKTLESQGGLTTTGVFLGKPRYGSPERLGGGGFDERSDLYSFGVVLYELLTGRCPVAGSEPAALMAGHLFRAPLDFAETDPTGRVPPELRAVVLKALAKKPEERMASCEEFIWELTMLQDRFPLTREETDSVWRVLLPLAPEDLPAVVPPGSTQDHLNVQFDLARTSASGLVPGLPPGLPGEQATLRTEAEPVPGPAFARPADPEPPVPRPDPTQRVASSEDLDSTWASRPMRVRPAAELVKAPGKPAAPAPAPSRVRAAAVSAPPSRKPLWIAAAGAVLILAALGLWLAQRPARVAAAPAETPATSAAPAAVPETAVTPAATPPPAAPAAQAPPAPAPRLVEKGASSKPRPTVVEARTPAAPLEPMKAGDLIRRGQPNVEEPEVKTLASYSYPAAAKGTGKKVTIRLAVLVDETGQATDVQIREGDKSGLGFEEAALAAARKTRFFPATRDGIAGRMWAELLLDFSE